MKHDRQMIKTVMQAAQWNMLKEGCEDIINSKKFDNDVHRYRIEWLAKIIVKIEEDTKNSMNVMAAADGRLKKWFEK